MSSPFEEGDPEAKICILGEAPSTEEIRKGRPLCGPSGELLERCLHGAGIIRRDCYIVNVFEDRVRKDRSDNILNTDSEFLWTERSGFSDLGREASANCLARS